MLFGISIDEHVLFKASLILLCFLSLLLILISILAVWLTKIQRRVVSLTKNARSLPLVFSWRNLVGATAYGPLGFDRDGHRSDLPQEMSFDNLLARGNDGKSVHDASTQEEFEVDDSSAAHHSTNNNQPQQDTKGDCKLEKVYMSLKNLKCAKDHTYAKPCANSPRVKSKMGCDERQNGRNEEQKDNAHEDDNEYIVVIHSDKSSSSSEGTENEMTPNTDESSYLIPIEFKPEENGHHGTEPEEKSKANGVSKNDDRASHLDDPEEGKSGYLSNQHEVKLTAFGHNVEFMQQIQPRVSKDADEDDSGYIIMQHVEDGAAGKAGTNIPVGQFQAGGTSERNGPVNPCHGDDNSYEYIQMKNWTSEVVVSDSGVQNRGAECSDGVPVYANNDSQQQSSMCNDSAAFCNVDESPLYDNP